MRSVDRPAITSILLLSFAVALFPLVAFASLVVESAVTRISIGPGSEWSGSVSVANTSGEPLTLGVEVVNLERTEQGTSVPLIGQNAETIERTAAGWVTTVHELTIEPRSRARVPVTIAVPSSVPPGLHLAALLFGVAPLNGGEGIAVTAATAAALEIVVTGDGEHNVSLVAFGPSQRLFARGPVPIAATFANRGSTVANLSGTLEIRSVSGGVKAAANIGPEGAALRLLPGSERSFELVGDIGPGLYRAVLNAADGAETYETSALFAVMPWPLGVVLLIAVATAILSARAALRFLLRRRK